MRGTSLSTPVQGAGAAHATKRIQRELKEISESPSRHWTAGPAADDLFEWQFAMRGPPGTDYEGGIYVGRIILPVNYPLAPPSIMLLTPNGRWEVGKKICLSNTNYHPDLWQPAWGIRTMMEALRSHFPMPGDGAIGALDWPSELRQRLARESLDWCAQGSSKPNRELLPELTPEELREVQPAPAPFLGPEEAAAEAREEAAAQPAETTMPDTSASDAAAGLRQRRGAPAAAPASSEAPAAAAAAEEETGGGASSSDAAPAPRRRRQPARQQRRAPPLVVQILKPPRTGREWVLLLMDLLILLLAISFLFGLTDLIRSPPKLLDPLPDPRSSSD